jgi:hypothetical protein
MAVNSTGAGCFGEAMKDRRAEWRRGAEERRFQTRLQDGDPVQIHRSREGQSAQTPDSTVVTIEDRGSQSLLTKPDSTGGPSAQRKCSRGTYKLGLITVPGKQNRGPSLRSCGMFTLLQMSNWIR